MDALLVIGRAMTCSCDGASVANAAFGCCGSSLRGIQGVLCLADGLFFFLHLPCAGVDAFRTMPLDEVDSQQICPVLLRVSAGRCAVRVM